VRTDVTRVATTESRARGGHARAAAIRERKERAREKAEAGLARHLDRAVGKLADLLESEDERVALQAANSIVDRVIGKAS
jgi:hypothetical protein